MKVSNNNGKEDNSMKNMSGNGTMPPPPMENISTPPPPMGFSKIENGISQATINNNTNEVKSICLQKGQKINLTKDNPGLTKVMIGLGWDVNKYDGHYAFDLDASAFLLGQDGKAILESDFIFYNNPRGRNDCIIHQGDNITGEGEGDDEQILIDFSKVPQEIHKIAITVTIYDYETRRQSFGQVSNAFVRVVDNNNNKELVRYDLGEDFSIETAIIVCELYRNNGEWKFSAVGSGFSGGLGALCKNYGLDAG